MSEDWIDQARRHLDESVRDLPAATASRLNQARQAALDQRPVRPRRWLGGLAVAAVLAVGLALGLALTRPASSPGLSSGPSPGPMPTTATAIADIEVLTAEAELELLADLEFYLWLEENWAEDAG